MCAHHGRLDPRPAAVTPNPPPACPSCTCCRHSSIVSNLNRDASNDLLLVRELHLVNVLDERVGRLVVRLQAAAELDTSRALLRVERPRLAQERLKSLVLLLTLLEHVALQRALCLEVVLFVLLRVVAQVTPHLLLLGLGEKRGRPRAPEQLVELVLLHVSALPAVRGPEVVAILHLVSPVRYRGRDEPARRVPLDVGAHKVLRLADGLHHVHVKPLELPRRALEVGEEQDAAGGRPEKAVAHLLLAGLEQRDAPVVLGAHGVDGDVCAVRAAVGVHNGEAEALGLPREGEDGGILGELLHLDGHAFVAQAEELKGRIESLLRLRVLVHLDAEEVALLVPRHAQVGHGEEVLLPQLGAGGQLHQDNLGGLVHVLRGPQGNDVVRRRPEEVADAVSLDRGALVLLVLDELHRARLVDVDAVFAEASEELVVVRPAECGPGHLGRISVLRALEGAQLGASGGRPYDEGLLLVALGCPCDDEALAGREIEQFHAADAEPLHPLPRRAGPQHDALVVESSKVRPSGRPGHIVLAPASPRVLGHWVRPCRVVPPDLALLVVTYDELVARSRVKQPALEVLLGDVRLRLGLDFLVGDGRVLCEVGEEVDHEHVRLVEPVAVRLGDRRVGFVRAAELDEGEAERHACLRVLWVVEAVFEDLAHLREELADDVVELLVLLGGYLRQAIDDDRMGKRRVNLRLLLL
mmetsp:Transcript_13238/g.28583  ORF Transcript_13238/g.28583 Transcript_13238/m.28583 type:complete len:697 (-) Transcript_13238:75-2165(-)